MCPKRQQGEAIRFAAWVSSFPFEASSIRLHEISWIEANKDFHFSMSKIKRMLFMYTIEGTGILLYKGKEYILKSGDAFIVDLFEGVELKGLSKNWQFIWLQMSSTLSYELLKYIERDRGNVIAVSAKIPALCHYIYSIASAGIWSSAADIEISVSLYHLLGLMIVSSAHVQIMENVLIHIHKLYMEKLRIDQLAQISCMSKYHFIRRFKDEVGITPHAYINEYRIKMAQEILVRDPSSIVAVAAAVGFEDASYFAEQFKKLTNYYPSEYRKLFNKKEYRKSSSIRKTGNEKIRFTPLHASS